MNNSATIVSASLDDNELRQSIANLVAHYKRALHTMSTDTDKTVAELQNKLKGIGQIKIDSGGTADGGSSRRTSKQKEEETQVKATTQAYKEQRTVVGELAMSFDNLNTAITKSNSKLAAKFDVTEQQKVQQLEAQRTAIEDKIVARQIEIDESYRSQLATLSKTRSELESKANLTSKEQADLKHVTTEWERINKIVRDISSRPIVAADDTTGSIGRLQQQLVETNKQLEESRKRIQEMNFERAKMYDGSLSGLIQNAQATMKYQNDTLKKSFEDLLKKPTHDVDEMRAKMERLQTFLNNIKPLNIFSPELITNGERAINKLKNEIQKFNDKPTKQAFADALKLPDRTQSEIITKINRIRDAIKSVEGTKIVSETEIARANSLVDSLRDKWSRLYNAPRDRQLRIDFADALKMPTNNIDEIAAKLMRLQYILQEMRGMEVLSPQQIANGNQQISALLSKLEAEMSLRQQINAVEQADMQNAQKRIELEAKYGDEVAKAAAIANEWLQKNKEAAILNKEGTFVIQDPKAGQTVGQSIEAQLLAYKAINGELNLELEVQKAIQNTVESIERAEQRRIALAQGGNATSNKSFADYEDLRTAIAAVLRVRESEVSLANSEDASYKALSLTLKQLKQAYESLDASQRKSENADALIASIHETQRAMQEIQKQMSRPVNLANVLALPEKTIDDISYKVQMLRAYAQGINIETNAGNEELRRVMSTIEGLNEGLKNAQKTTKQITIESNGIKFDNIAKMPTESLKQVGAKIKEVKQYINELKNQPIVDEKNLKRAEALYDRLIKQSQKLNETKGTHSNVNDALNVRVKTLDEIAKKMQRLQAIRQNLDINKQKADIDRINAALGELKKQQDGVLQRNANMIKSNNALGRSWNYMKNRLAFYFTVGASTQFIKNLIEVRSQYEMNERALGILINSAERGTQIFNELSQMALVSPYTLIELSNAAKQLTAYDIAAKDVVDTTRRLADMASAVGVPMERLTYALGQIKAYGYLNSRDARMFANAGIPLVRELSKYYSELEGKVVSVGDVYDRMKKKAIDYNSVMAVVTKMTDEGGKFFDFQAKMADTLKVRLANLTLAWNNMLNDIGASRQGVLTSGIGILGDLFLHWQDIYGAIQRVVLAIGLWKGAQALALLAVGELNTKMGMQVLLGEKLQTRLSSLAGSTKNLVSGYAVAGAALLFVIADAIMTYQRNAEEIEKLNKVIVDGAKESANSIYEFIESAEMSYARLTARTGKLPKPDAEKTWDALREQIELSAISAKDIIPELIKIEDLNERVTKAFNLAERIAEANNKLIDLDGKLDISQDSILFGLFGEGLVEDIDDFNERLRISAQTEELYFKSTGSVITDVVQGLTGFFNDMKEKLGSSTEEAEREIKNFAHNAADAIKDELGEEGLKDSIQVNEAVSRVLKGIEQQFPQIKGKGKALFESIYNDIMANEFNGAVDKQAYYYKLFLERLKKDHASAFQGVTEDIDRETFMWSDAQMKAIQKTADRIKEDIPEAYKDSVTEILNDLNTREFKMRIVAEFATTSIDDINKAFRKRFIEAGVESVKEQVDEAQNGINKIKGLSPWGGNDEERKRVTQQETENLQKYGFLMKKANESDLDYQERISKERQKSLDISAAESKIIATNTGKEKEGAKVVLASAIEQKKAADERLKAISDVAEWGGYDFSTKKENSAATKAQHAAETELQKALKDELQLIDKVRSQYKKLTDAGATDGEALTMVTNQFANSLAHVNKVLGKNGIPLFDISKFAGTDNPRALLDMLKLQLDSAKIAKNIKPEEIKELEVKYSEIVVDAKSYDLTKVTKGLNNELDRLKDEYELAVSLDADPELGNMFADWMGIDMSDLPRTAQEYAERASKILNNNLKDLGAKTKLPNVLDITDDDMRAFEENKTFTDKQLEFVKKAVEAARGFQRKETEERIKDWDKLLEKYAEYETKVNRIQNDAVKERVSFAQQFGSDEEKSMALKLQTQILAATDPQEKQKLIEQLRELVLRIAGDDKTKINLVTAIDNSQDQGIAKTNFEEFQKSPEWIIATGELSGMTNKAIKGLIASLEKYKKTAKGLDGKQIKNINNALKNLYKEQRKNNPFGAIANMIDEAKERLADVEPEMESIMSDIIALEKEIGDGEATEEQIKTLDELKKRWKELSKIGEISASEWVASLMSVYSAIKGAIGLFDDLAKAIGGKEGSDIERVFGVLDKAGQGAQIGAAFGGYGAAIGAVAGAATGFIKEFGDEFSGNSSINTNVKQSEINIRRLQTAFKDLEYEIEKVGGTGELTLRKIAIASREWQLAELKRQLTLEESRDSKNRDEERIEDLRSQIKDLELDLKRAADEIVNDFLGISSVGDAAENMMGAFISALRSGEDAMASFNDSIDDMIANMLKKILATKILEPKLQEIWDNIQSEIDKRTKSQTEELQAIEEFSNRGMMDYLMRRLLDGTPFVSTNESWLEGTTEEYKELWEKMYSEYQARTGKSAFDEMGHLTEDFANWFLNSSSDYLDDYKKMLEHELANAWQEGDIKNFAEQLENLSPEIQGYIDYVNELIKELGLDASSQQSLSSLQQGIQSVSETTASALEGYMNGISQQVYYHSTLLEQIRDAIVGADSDIQLGVQGQILLQLQTSYQTQQAIQSILEGWSSPNGMSVRVEMV